MPKLVFRVSADYEEVIKLRNEIEKLKKELKSMDVTTSPVAFNTLNTQLSMSTKKMDEMVTEAAKAGAAMEGDFKKKIFDASQTVNGFTEKIIAQKAVVKDVEADVRRLGEAYRSAKKNNPWGADTHLAEYNAARRALDEEKTSLFALTQEQANARLSVKKLRDEYALYRGDSKETVVATEGIGISLKKAFSIIGGAALGKQFISDMVRVRGEFQAADTAIQTLLGSKEKADALMSQVREYAKISPLEFSDVTQATQMMLGFNIEAEKVPRFLQAIGDASMGDTQRFNSLTLAFSQMSAAGKLMGQDLNQMINAGFNPLLIMSEKTGKSFAQLKDEMSKGAISAEMVQQAFIDATSAGGKFYHMSENASKTINGQLSMMQDAIDTAFNEMGQKSEGFIMSGIQMTTTLIENYETVGKVLAGLVVTYGTYKAALIANIALTQSWAVAARADAVAKGIQTTATKAQTVAQLALNAAMKANPYAILAAVIAGIGTTLWAFTKTTNQAAEAQKRLDEATANMRKEIVSEQADIDILFNDLKNAKKGTDEYAQAKDAILNKYGKYLEGLSEEIRTLKNVKGAYDAITAAATKAARARGLETAMRGAQEAYGETYSGSAGKLYDKLREAVGDTKTTSLLNRLKKEINNTGKASKKLREEIASLFTGTSTYGRSKAWITGMENATRTLKDETKKIKAVFGDVDSKKGNKGSKGKATTYQEDLNSARKEWDTAKRELSKIEKDKSKFTSKQYEDAKKRKETAEKAYKDLGGVVSTTSTKRTGGTSEKDNRLEAEKKANEELLKLQQENQQAQLDLEEETTEKKLKLIDLSYNKQKAEIAKKEREFAEQNKKAGTKGLNEKGLTTEQQTEINKANEINEKSREEQISDTYKVELQSMRDYLKEYGSFQQQKLAITEEYAEKIAQAGDNEWEKKSLEKQRESALQKVEIDALRQEIDWKGLLGDFGGLFEEQLKPTLEKLRKYTESNEFKQADIQDQQVIYDLITKLTQETSDGWSGMFKNLGDATNNYREKVIALEKATEEAKKADEEYAIAKTKAGDNAATDENVKALGEAARNAAENQKAAQSDVIQAQNEMSDAATRVRENLNNLTNGLQQLGSGSMSGILGGADSIAKIFGENDLKGEIAKGLSKTVGGAFGEALDGPMGGEIVEGVFALLDLFKDGIENLFTSLIDTILGAVNGLLSTALSLDVPIAIGKSLKEGLGNILNTITFGGFDSWFGIGGNAKEVAETINRLTSRNEELQKSIDNLSDIMKDATGAMAISTAVQAEEYQRQKNKNLMGIVQANMAYSHAHHSWGYNWNGFTAEQNEWIRKNVKADWKGGDEKELVTLTPEEMKKLLSNQELRDAIYAPDYGGRVLESLDAYAAEAGKIKEITDALKEALTQISFDSLRDSFVDSLMDMDKDAQDFADDFSKYLMQAMLNAQIDEMLGDELQAFYDKWAEYSKDVSGEGYELTEEELNLLRKDWDDITQRGLSIRDSLSAITGYGSEKSTEQSATAKGVESITADQTDQLIGRVTAIQIGVENGNAMREQEVSAVNILNANLAQLVAANEEQTNKFDGIADILAQSYLVQQDIRDNTGISAKALKVMQSDLADIKNKIKSL